MKYLAIELGSGQTVIEELNGDYDIFAYREMTFVHAFKTRANLKRFLNGYQASVKPQTFASSCSESLKAYLNE